MDKRTALAAAKVWMLNHPEVHEVYWGVKNDDLREGMAVVFAVSKKRPLLELPADEIIPRQFVGARTDVIERTMPEALALTARRRPCPAGFSIGHVAVTAGTFGAPVKRGASNEWLALTNNHVAANSNDAGIGDSIIQPGSADGGTDPTDRWGTLVEYVEIAFEGAPDKKKNDMVARAWWSSIKGIGNFGAWLVRCPYRVHVGPRAVQQPNPNLVDAALVRPLTQDALSPVVYDVGPVEGIRDLRLDDSVHKVGRTTEHTHGRVVGTDGMVRVSYGAGRIAVFDDQIISDIESAGGDSGSAILTSDNYLGGLLFAGGNGQTIINKAVHVVALLGIRV